MGGGLSDLFAGIHVLGLEGCFGGAGSEYLCMQMTIKEAIRSFYFFKYAELIFQVEVTTP